MIIAGMMLLAAASDAGTAMAGQSVTRVMTDMAPYVYPGNVASTFDRPQFMPDGETYLQLEGRVITSVNIATGKTVETIFDTSNTRGSKIDTVDDFTVSPDGSKLLLATGTRSIYRHSVKAQYYVYEIRTRMLTPLSETHTMQRSPLFSPDGRIVAFVADDNNIYLKKLDYNTEVAVTTDGAVDSVINGVPDWVYEEEFATTCSMAWAPDSRTLCYLRYDESRVPAFSFSLYGGSCDPMEQYQYYPGLFTCKYPVAGQPNSTVALRSYDVDNRKIKSIEIGDSRTEYIPRIEFGGSDPDRLMVVTLDRSQTRMEVFAVNPRSAVSHSVLTEQTEAWLPVATYEQLHFAENSFVVLSARSGYQHAYEYNYAGAMTRQITSGNYDVTAYYGSDSKGNHYVQSTAGGAINRVVSRIDSKGQGRDLSPSEGYASAWLTPSAGHYALTYSNVSTPTEVNLCSTSSLKEVRNLCSNEYSKTTYASAPATEFITIPNADGELMNASIIRPAGFSTSKQYPVILYQYSGPGSQEVLNRWKPDWKQYAAMQGYVVVTVDPRGTGGRGRAWETVVYRRLGECETADLHAAARWISSQSWADGSRIGITGWSYGGYETLMAASVPGFKFAAAVAIAPVTDWRYYDSIYAERYMLTPKENASGYRDSAPMSHVSTMNVPLLIMHGTADDNVHLSNTMEYVSALQAEGILADMWLYPNMNHSILGCDARLNVYSKMLDFFNRNMK